MRKKGGGFAFLVFLKNKIKIRSSLINSIHRIYKSSQRPSSWPKGNKNVYKDFFTNQTSSASIQFEVDKTSEGQFMHFQLKCFAIHCPYRIWVKLPVNMLASKQHSAEILFAFSNPVEYRMTKHFKTVSNGWQASVRSRKRLVTLLH